MPFPHAARRHATGNARRAHHFATAILIVAGAAAWWGPSAATLKANVINGSFESGDFSGWSIDVPPGWTGGPTSWTYDGESFPEFIVHADADVPILEPGVSVSWAGGFISPSNGNAFGSMGIDAVSFVPQPTFNSGTFQLRNSFSAAAGDTLSFDFAVYTDSGLGTVNLLQPSGATQTIASTPLTPATPSGWTHVELTLVQAGLHQISFGVSLAGMVPDTRSLAFVISAGSWSTT